LVLKRHERMPQALGQVDGAPVDGIQQHGLPLPERRGADADVDDDVEQRSGDRGDLLACDGGTSAKWMPPTVPLEDTEMLVCMTCGRWPRRSASRSPRKDSRKPRGRPGTVVV